MAKNGKAYTIGKEIILPAMKDVMENVMKEDCQVVMRCIPLSANTVQRRIEEMANDVGKNYDFRAPALIVGYSTMTNKLLDVQIFSWLM